MRLKAAKVLGSISLLIGIFFLLNASVSITGFAILEGAGKGFGYILGILFIAAGIGLLSYRESEDYDIRESKLRKIVGENKYENLSEKDKVVYNKAYRRHLEAEERREYQRQKDIAHEKPENHLNIIRTQHFERAIRGYDEKTIERAINKIGTGMGKEKKLATKDAYSVRVAKGDRILFSKRRDGTIILKDFILNDEYKRRAI